MLFNSQIQQTERYGLIQHEVILGLIGIENIFLQTVLVIAFIDKEEDFMTNREKYVNEILDICLG